MESNNNNETGKLKVAIYSPIGSKIVQQRSSNATVYLYTGERSQFCREYADKADWLWFMNKAADISAPDILDHVNNELENDVAIYFNFFFHVEKPNSKILSFFDIYNKSKFRSLTQIVQCPVLVQSKFIKNFSFDKRLTDLHNYQLLLSLTDRCMIKRSNYIIDGFKPVKLNVENDLKILHEHSTPQH